VDGSAPLEIWLRNAVQFLQPYPQATLFQQALAEVSRRVAGAPPVQDPTAPDLPQGSLPTGLEKTIQRDDTLPYRFVAGAQRVGASVARLEVPQYRNGIPALSSSGEPVVFLGTAWLVRPDLLVTNHHVVNARDEGDLAASPADLNLQAEHLRAQFDYDDAARPGLSVGAARLEASDSGLDYALLRLSGAVAGRQPLTLAADRLAVQGVQDYVPVNIIQHPGGRPKRVAIRNNLIYRANYPDVSYFTDTEGGSSGSPVCTDDWRVVALHRSWAAIPRVRFQGRDTAWVNEGTQIAAILEHLKLNHPASYTEITGA